MSSEVEEINTDGLFKQPAASQRDTKPTRKRTTVPKTTIPEDFSVTADMRQWAAENAPNVDDVDLETRLFVNYFLDKPTKRPGWRRSWESWMLRAHSWASKRDNVRQLRPTGTDSRYSPQSGSRIQSGIKYSSDPKDVFG